MGVPRLRSPSLLLGVAALGMTLQAQSPRHNETGYDLWLRFPPVTDRVRLAEYRAAIQQVVVSGDSPTIRETRNELQLGLTGLLDDTLTFDTTLTRSYAIVAGTPRSSRDIADLPLGPDLLKVGNEGYLLRAMVTGGHRLIVVAGNTDIGVLHGAFALLRRMQMHATLRNLADVSAPRIEIRMLDHWDNLDRTVEHGYAGKSLWEWDRLPDTVTTRYWRYARANASIGINGVSLTNVNANAQVLTAAYLAKAAALANIFRPFGIRVYLTARFSAPIEIGGLKTADPLDADVRAWWKTKADEIYRFIPDFGGFVVKANSEGQPGPQDYHRTHADGANMLADAVAPHGGVVIWRAFVYSAPGDRSVDPDRIKQAYEEFAPLDGTFRDNVLLQVKNGPLDFQPREPFSPLFGAMPHTPLMLELQITKEYLGQDTHLAYLGTYYKEVLNSDTWAKGKGSTVAKVIDGSLHHYQRTGIAGVANIGTDTNWTGSQFNQANWYVFGRLAWNPSLTADGIADEWIRMTWSNDPAVVAPIKHMMMISREAVVDYMTPLGLAHIMATGHHYGPAPWVNDIRMDWRPTYYHRADTLGIGFDRTATGSNAVAQYFEPVRSRLANRATISDSLLLFFHHVGWNEKTHAGLTVWNDLVRHYYAGVDSVRSMERSWRSVKGKVDAQRYGEVESFLTIQEHEAKWWRDAALLYFQQFSRQPIPSKYEKPAHPLSFYMSLKCPADVTKPRCPPIY